MGEGERKKTDERKKGEETIRIQEGRIFNRESYRRTVLGEWNGLGKEDRDWGP